MPAYNFQEQFAFDVQTGVKHQTIRSKRKHRPSVGQTAYCFSGMRTKKCRLLCVPRIRAVYDVRIDRCGVLLNGGAIVQDELDLFALRDGFHCWAAMLLWFLDTHGLPFHGDLIQW
jgi:hypothetical protein